jgi:hypothetical protein
VLLIDIGEFMVSVININNGSKEPTDEYQKCSTNSTSIFGGYLKMTESCIPKLLFRSIPL